jgi:hypothetical protein
MVHILADDLNEVDNASLRGEVEAYLDERTVPGVDVVANQYNTRLVVLSDIQVKYEDGADQSATNDRITAALEEEVDALTWEYGQKLYLNEVVALLDGVEGVKRIAVVNYKTSDDFGANWSTSIGLTNAGLDPGSGPAEFGLLHYGTNGSYSAPSTNFIAL